MDNWPLSLPCPLADGFQYVPQDNQIRSEIAAGVQKTRRRYSGVAEDATVQLLVDEAQVAILDDFVVNTLRDTLPFVWVNFRLPTRPARSYRFVRRPTYTPAGPGLWMASLSLEMLP